MQNHAAFDLIVFDWDGTLMDSAGAIVVAIQKACRDLDLPPPTDAAVRQVIGLELGQALRQAVPAMPVQQMQQLAERYRFHYLGNDHELRLFANVRPMLEALTQADKKLAVATGKSRVGLVRAMRQSDTGRFFLTERTADECPSKPNPQMLLDIMDELQTPPERTLMVGDTTHDLELAHNAGVRALGVAFGAHPKATLQRAPHLAVLDTPQALQDWFFAEASAV